MGAYKDRICFSAAADQFDVANGNWKLGVGPLVLRPNSGGGITELNPDFYTVALSDDFIFGCGMSYGSSTGLAILWGNSPAAFIEVPLVNPTSYPPPAQKTVRCDYQINDPAGAHISYFPSHTQAQGVFYGGGNLAGFHGFSIINDPFAGVVLYGYGYPTYCTLDRRRAGVWGVCIALFPNLPATSFTLIYQLYYEKAGTPDTPVGTYTFAGKAHAVNPPLSPVTWNPFVNGSWHGWGDETFDPIGTVIVT